VTSSEPFSPSPPPPVARGSRLPRRSPTKAGPAPTGAPDNAPSPPARRNHLGLILRLAIGAIILAAILHIVGVRETITLLAGASKPYLAAAAALYFLMHVAKTWRWHAFLQSQHFDFPRGHALHVYFLSSLVGAFTPGRIGEASRLLAPAQGNRRYAESLACTAIDKAFDVWLLILLLVASSFSTLLSSHEALVLRLLGAAAAIGTALSIALLFRFAAHPPRIPAALLRLAPRTWARVLTEQPQRLLTAAASSLRAHWLRAVVLTLLFWVLHVGCHYLMLLSLASSMDLWYFVLCLTLVGLVEFVPITVCGLGTREVLLVYLFGRAGLGADIALAFGLLSICFTYLVTALFTFAVGIAIKKGTR